MTRFIHGYKTFIENMRLLLRYAEEQDTQRQNQDSNTCLWTPRNSLKAI